LHEIPCCYEFGLDFERIQKQTGLTRDRIIFTHADAFYTVYAVGFCPGFPYLGYLPSEIANVPRLESPRLKVDEGSVGLTGKQTGIYTEARPGGWNIVGKTPLQLVCVQDEYFPLRTGDRVRFRRIDEREFKKLKGERLAVV
jgi:inhibitor of KinA